MRTTQCEQNESALLPILAVKADIRNRRQSAISKHSLRNRAHLLVGFLNPGELSLEMAHGKPGVLAGDKIVMIAGPHDRFHRSGVEKSVLDEALVDVNANDLAEGDEARGGLAVDIVEP